MRISKIKSVTVSAVMGALGFILMLLEFSIPIMPEFIKFDISELPALITSFAYGPVCGVLVCLVKNLLHIFVTHTVAVGELSNFILGAVFTATAGIIYKLKKTRTNAIIGSVIGAAVMSVVGIATNYFLVYPMYAKFYGMPLEAILEMYRVVYPKTENLLQALIIFNLPFNFVKGLAITLICAVIYKKISPILKKIV